MSFRIAWFPLVIMAAMIGLPAKHATASIDGNLLVRITAGARHTCALKADGEVWCWGASDHRQLGPDGPWGPNPMSSVPVQVPGFTATPVDISAGDDFTCALETGGKVECWGNSDGPGPSFSNSVGAVGGTWSAPATSISANGNHACAALSDGTVKCWGDNWNYQLGLDDQATAAMGFANNGIGTGNIAVTVPGVKGATRVAAGRDHSCALLTQYIFTLSGILVSHPVQCWGNDHFGQIGVAIPADTYVHDQDFLVYGSSSVNMEAFDVFAHHVSGLSDATAVTASDYASCAVSPAHGIYCWGGSGQGDVPNTWCSLDCWFGANLGFWGAVPSGSPSSLVSRGSTGCAIYSGNVYCWGDNNYGKTGGANAQSLSAENTLMNQNAGAVAVGVEHVCAIAGWSTRVIMCWGSNNYGQLGNATLNNATTNNPAFVVAF